MAEYKHINDCWNALRNCSSLNEVYRAIDDFPHWSGDWEVCTDDGKIIVYNEYYDHSLDDYQSDREELDIPSPDLVLEYDELWCKDLRTGDIEVDKDIFDDFQEDKYVKIFFSDRDLPIGIYIMKYETDNTIGMMYIGEAGKDD